MDSKEIKPVHPKENQRWIFIGRTDTKAEAPILSYPDAQSQLIGKTLMMGRTENKRRRGRLRMRWSDSITNSRMVKPSAAVHGVWKSRTWLTKLNNHHKRKWMIKWKSQKSLNQSISSVRSGGFPRGPMAKTLCSPCRGRRFNPWSRN